MKRNFVSTLIAIALAVPLGIGGLALTTTDAGANAVLHHFQTCSRDVIHRCDSSIQVKVLEPNDILNTRYTSRWLPRGSNGIDDGAYVRLFYHWRFHRRHGGPNYRPTRYDGRVQSNEDRRQTQLAVDILRRVFNDDAVAHRPDLIQRFAGHYTQPLRNLGVDVVSPYERNRILAFIEHEKEAERDLEIVNNELVARYEANCRRHRGEWRPTLGPLGRGECRVFTHYNEENRPVYRTDVFVGFNPDDPHGYVQRIEDYLGPVEPDADRVALQVDVIDRITRPEISVLADHQTETINTREALVALQNDHNFVEDQLTGMINRNSESIGSVAERVDMFSAGIRQNREQIDENTAGIALAYALAAPGLSHGKNFAAWGSVGHFSGESAVGFTGTFKVGESWLASVGGGFAGSGVGGGKVAVGFEW